MPPVGVASVPEMDAAVALLELQDSRESQREAPKQHHLSRADYYTTEVESTATEELSLQRYGNLRKSSGIRTSTPNSKSAGPSSPTIIKLLSGGYIIRNNTSSPARFRNMEPINKKRSSLHKKYQEEQKRWSKEKALKTINGVKKSRDMATQTEVEYQLPQLSKMESFIQELCGKIKKLENQLEINGKVADIERNAPKTSMSSESMEDISGNGTSVKIRKYNTRVKTTSSSNSSHSNKELYADSDDDSDYKIEERSEDMDEFESESLSDERKYANTMIRKCNTITNGTNDLVPIGDGNANVPSRLLRTLDWTSYTNATRKLLTAVFSRGVLATHSLTGKPSPAFPDKPAKKKLDPALVNDIVQTVVDRCKVPENVVRTSITTKCADESKMLRSRQKNKKKSHVLKKENIPPTRTSGSEESTRS